MRRQFSFAACPFSAQETLPGILRAHHSSCIWQPIAPPSTPETESPSPAATRLPLLEIGEGLVSTVAGPCALL